MFKKTYLFLTLLTAFLSLGSGTMWGETLTVAEGTTTNAYLPIYGYYSDAGFRGQFIYPASTLSDLSDGVISGLRFYSANSTWASGSKKITVKIGEVENATFSGTSFISDINFTQVYNGSFSVASKYLDITFDANYTYNGGNLLVQIFETTTGNGDTGTSFYGQSSTGAGLRSYKSGSTWMGPYSEGFLPMVTFTYTPGTTPSCAKPTTVEVAEENIESNSATITLAGLNNATVEYKKKSATDYIVAETAVTGTSYELTGLDSYTEYDIQVKNVCGGTDGESKYVKASFRTKCGPKTIPFAAYGFDDITYSYGQYTIPACWDKIASGNYPYVYGYNGKSGNSLYFNGTSEQAIIFPDFSKSIAGHTLTFYHRESVDENWYGTNYVYSKFEVGYVLNNVFTTISGPLAQLSAYAADPTEVAFTEALPTGAKLAIRYAGGANNGSGYIDDIAIKVTPSCEKPTLNDATAQTFEGATFTWDGSAAQYQYAVVASGASVETWSEPISEKTYTVTGKAAGSTFDFYVRSYCGTTEQSESVKKSFTTATIPAPTNVTISGETTTGASASWDAVAGIIQYQYVVMEAGVAADWTSPTTVNTNAATISGLLPGQSYDLYVRSYYAANGATSAATPKKNFKTECEAITSFPWTEDFDDETDGTIVNCWNNSGSTSATVSSSPHYIWGVYHGGTWSTGYYDVMRMYNSLVKAGTALINTPSFTLPNDKNYEFTFKYAHQASCGNFVINVSENGGAFTAIPGASYANSGTTSTTLGEWTDATIDLTAYKGKTITLQFFATADYDAGVIYVDDLSIHEKASCSKPATLNDATSITPEGATFTWLASTSDSEDFYQYICVAGGTAEGDIDWTASTKVAKAETNQAVLSGKAAGTYDFYVRSWCSESEQSEALKKSFITATVPVPTIGTITATNNSANASWTAPTGISYTVQYQWSINGTDWSEPTSELSAAITSLEQNTNYTFYVRSYYDATHLSAEVTKVFTTECDPIAVSAAEYAETFDDITSGIPACWKNNEGTTTTESYKWNSAASGQSGRCVRFESRNNGTGKTNILASPLFELNADADLSFYVKNFKGGDYKVQIAVDGDAREDLFTDLTNIQNWTKKEAALTAYNGHTIQFFFCGTSNWSESSNGYLYLDEFKITPAACRKPASRPVASDVTANSATLTWGISPAAAYQYSLVEAGNVPAWEDIDTNTKTFDNLQPTTTYDFAVRSACGGADFSDTLMVSFRTDCGAYALPFEENFNSLAANAIPECWSNAEGTSTDYYKWKGYTYGGTEGTNCVRFNSSTNGNGNTNVLATPTIQLGEGNMLTFYAKNPTGGAFKVQIKEEGAAEATDLLTGLTGIENWTRKYVNIPAAFNNKKVQIRFHATSNEGDANAYIFIDDVRVSNGIALADNADNSEILSNNNNKTLDVVIGRTIVAASYFNTICLPFDLPTLTGTPLEGGDLWAFKYAAESADSLLFRIVEASSIEAGVPYFIAFPDANENIVNPLFKNVTIAATQGKRIGDASVAEFVGILDQPETFTHGDQNKLFLAANNTLYWWNGTIDSQLNAFRAFFQTSSNNPVIRRGMPVRIVKQEEVATDLDNIYEGESAQKRLENNQVVIIRNGVKYTIQGQVISK